MIAALRAGEAQALGTLYGWYGEILYRQVLLPRLPQPELAEDCLRDVFRTALERIHQFELRDRSVYFWLRRIALNRATDQHRALQRQRRLEDRLQSAEESLFRSPTPPDRYLERQETRALIEEALESLNPRYAKVLRLRLLEGRERQDCADRMGVSLGSLDVLVHRAVKAFRKRYPPR